MEIIKFVQSFSNPFFDTFFQLVTMLGEDTFIMLITALIYWCVDKDMGYKLGFITLTSAYVNLCTKDIFKVPRPIGEPGIRSLRVQTAGGYSFPSGHTQNTATIWTFFMIQFKRRWLYVVGAIMILLVGISRLYLGVHTPFDLVGGVIIGTVWTITWSYIYEMSIRYKKKWIIIMVVMLATIGLLVFKDSNYYKIVGTLTGMTLGYLVEQRFIRFKEKARLLVQVLKVSFGIAVLCALRLVLKSILPELLIADYIRYLILILWVTTLAPLIFKRFEPGRI